MGVFDHLYVESIDSLQIPSHVLAKFNDLGYPKDKLLQSLHTPIQVHFDGFFDNLKLDDSGKVWRESERDSKAYTKIAADLTDSFNLTLYDNGESGIDFELNAYIHLEKGVLRERIFWHNCQITKDGVTYRWEYDDDFPEDIDFYDPSTYVPGLERGTIEKYSITPEAMVAFARSLVLPLSRPVGYRDVAKKMVR